MADERAAKKVVDESDREPGKFLQRFYDVGHELPTRYDLTVNTDSVAVARAAKLIAQATRT